MGAVVYYVTLAGVLLFQCVKVKFLKTFSLKMSYENLFRFVSGEHYETIERRKVSAYEK